jgi:hypothetical protein
LRFYPLREPIAATNYNMPCVGSSAHPWSDRRQTIIVHCSANIKIMQTVVVNAVAKTETIAMHM